MSTATYQITVVPSNVSRSQLSQAVHYKMRLNMKPKALIETDQNITAKKPNKSQNPVK